MEHVMWLTLGSVILALCLFAWTTLKRLNQSLGHLSNEKQVQPSSIAQLKSSIGIGKLVMLVISSVLVLGGLAQNQLAKKKAAAKTVAVASDEDAPKPKGPPIDLATATVLIDESSLKNGAERFKNLCASCHGQSGEGMVGPNFCDNFWLHGGEFKDLCKTITEGVPAKGMIAWGAQLSALEIKEVASYILSLEGSNPANQKAAQGVKFDRKEVIAFAIKPAVMAAAHIPKISLKGDKAHGQTLFNGILGCAHCHGSNSEGHVDNRNLRAIKKRYLADAGKVYDTVMEIGRLGTAMPPWGHLTIEEKQDIKSFIFSIQEK
jgi:mono/diheme cytochrome c family protein